MYIYIYIYIYMYICINIYMYEEGRCGRGTHRMDQSAMSAAMCALPAICWPCGVGFTSCVVKPFRSRDSFMSSPLWTPCGRVWGEWRV